LRFGLCEKDETPTFVKKSSKKSLIKAVITCNKIIATPICGKGQNYKNQNVEKPKKNCKSIKASEHRNSFLN
jgi:hypothetical protein